MTRDRRRGHRDGTRLRFFLDAPRRRSRCGGADRAHRRASARSRASIRARSPPRRCPWCSTGGSRAVWSVISPSAINGSAVARKTSFLKDKLGERLFQPGIRIVDDPLRQRGLRSRPFDGEGVAAKQIALVEDGVLKTWLLDCATARELGLTTTGHAQRGVSSPPSPGADQPPSRGRAAHARRADRRYRRRASMSPS